MAEIDQFGRVILTTPDENQISTVIKLIKAAIGQYRTDPESGNCWSSYHSASEVAQAIAQDHPVVAFWVDKIGLTLEFAQTEDLTYEQAREIVNNDT